MASNKYLFFYVENINENFKNTFNHRLFIHRIIETIFNPKK